MRACRTRPKAWTKSFIVSLTQVSMPCAKAERFIRTLKYEEGYLNDWPGCTQPRCTGQPQWPVIVTVSRTLPTVRDCRQSGSFSNTSYSSIFSHSRLPHPTHPPPPL